MKRLSLREYGILFVGRYHRDMGAGLQSIEAALAPIVAHAYRAGLAYGRGERERQGRTSDTPFVSRTEAARIAVPYRLAVAFRHGIKPAKLGERCIGTLEAPIPLHELGWLLKTVEGLSFPNVAVGMGRGNHTSAIHAYRQVEAAIAARPALRDELMALVPAKRRAAA